jgi:tetratricopeptide (TPR) repeat protein
MRPWAQAVPALLAASCLIAAAGEPTSTRAQGLYVPAPPEQDSILNPEQRKDPRVAPRDAWNPYPKDPYVPKNQSQGFVNNDYFAIPINSKAAQLIPVVENAHLGSKNNPRGFWPRYTEGNIEQALHELNYVLWVFPNHPRALFLLGMVARQVNQPMIPIAYYEKAIRLFPDRAYTYAQYGAYLVDVGEKTQGILQLQKALQMDPNLLPARAWLDKARRSVGLETGDDAAPGGASAPTQLDGTYVPRR